MGETKQSITIGAPAERVWEAVRDFHDMSWAPKVVTKCTPVGEVKGDQVGAKRILNDAFHETLLEVNAAERTLRYSIDDGPRAVSEDTVDNYIGVIQVRAADEASTIVEWNSSWQHNDEETYEFCHPLYLALLDDMKKSLE